MFQIDFSQRSAEKELMDTESVSFTEFNDCLRNLEWINVCSLAYRPTLQWLRKISHRIPEKEFSIIDIGSGGGDMLRRIWKWAQANKFTVNLTGVDINPSSKELAELATPSEAPIVYKTADLFSLETERHADIIISSLFTHHLSDEDVVRFIRWMDSRCKTGWHINDLHRHPIPYFFIKWVTKILPVNRLVKHDAAVSVARSFTKSDWERLLQQAQIPHQQVTIKWFFPFRYSVSCLKT